MSGDYATFAKYMEPGAIEILQDWNIAPGTRVLDVGCGAVARAKLVLDEQGGGKLENLQVIWRQSPKLSGEGHFGYRIAFDGLLACAAGDTSVADCATRWERDLGSLLPEPQHRLSRMLLDYYFQNVLRTEPAKRDRYCRAG